VTVNARAIAAGFRKKRIFARMQLRGKEEDQVNRGFMPKDVPDFSGEQKPPFISLFPCDINALIGLLEIEEKNEIKLDFGLKNNQGFKS
jgi:succinate dehydrogenase flavin-adding protein (antitoxin of CptAB toxin-antitoxin module)